MNNDSSFQLVHRDQFFAAIGNLNVNPEIVSSWPFKTEWRLAGFPRTLIGISQERRATGGTKSDYYLPVASNPLL